MASRKTAAARMKTSNPNENRRTTEASPRIGLLNHIGGGNLGDDATVAAVMVNIKRRQPNAAITAFTINPADTAIRHGIPSYPISRKTWSFGYTPVESPQTFKRRVKDLAHQYAFGFRLLRTVNALAIRLPLAVSREAVFLARSLRILRGFDLLVVSGGGQLTERDGPWSFPYTLFKWVLLARCARAKCFFLNVGAGPLCRPLSRAFVRIALRAAQYVSFRDSQSQILAKKIGFKSDSQICPDSVYSLELPDQDLDASDRRGGPRVGIAPMPYCDPRVDPAEKKTEVYRRYIGDMAIFASLLAKESYVLELFGTDIGVDPLAIEDLKGLLQERYGVLDARYDPVTSLSQLLMKMAALDFVVTSRFHGVVFAHVLNKPVLAVSHHPKVATLMAELGLSEYCVDIESFDPTALAQKFAGLVDNAGDIKRQMKSRAMSYKAQLTSQFDQLFSGGGRL